MIKKIAIACFEVLFAVVFYAAVASALTWPAVQHLDQIVIGGGELGGWVWREWWHFSEIESLDATNMGLIGSVEELVSLGRYPETGNILDILTLSYPLHNLFGFPAGHNMKILLILVGNGLCGYALGRTCTDSYLVALAVGSIAILNPLVIQDINKLGLRQVILWWLLLLPIFMQRASRSGSIFDGILVGVCFTLVSAFYWFYGLFAAMFGLVWIIWWWTTTKPPWRHAIRWLSAGGIAAIIGLFIFLLPYFATGDQGSSGGGTQQLPELTFFLDYPSYDTVSSAPERPTNYRDNVLSSLHRGIDSAWPADVVLDPRHGVQAFPVVIFLVGVIPAFFIKQARIWLIVWIIFWLGTMGPFLKFGAVNEVGKSKDTADVVMLGDYVVRMPYCWMFQYIPGMSRMFAPYRMACMMVVASIPLVALSLDRIRTDYRRLAALGILAAIVLQPFYRFDYEGVGPDDATPSKWRVPTQVSEMRIPTWYEELDPNGWDGIIEMPLEQQQDLLCAYQSVHRRKVYRSWASTPAVPPWIRNSGGGLSGKRLRWLAKEPPQRDNLEPVLRTMSRRPEQQQEEEEIASLADVKDDDLIKLMKSGNYRWLIIHERGYYLVDPNKGKELFEDVVRQFQERLQMELSETPDGEMYIVTEQEAFDWPGRDTQFPVGPAWIPWASQEVQKPVQDMPKKYVMAVFDLHQWKSWQEVE